MMCVPPGILCASNKMTSSQMGWLELSHRSGSEREDLKGHQRGNESLNSLPPSLGTLRGGVVHQHRRVFSKAAPRLCRPSEVASEHSLARVPERPAPESPPPLHLAPSWACQVSQSEIPPEPSTEMQSGGNGEQLLYPCSVFTANKCS